MAEIDGQYEGPSVTRALARSKYKKQAAAQEKPLEGGGGDNAVQHLAKAHPEAQGASKSFHVYAKEGKLHAHAHDHQAGTHDQREHVSMADVAQHMHEHMGEEKQEIMDEREGNPAEPKMEHEGGMGELGM